MSLHEFIEQNKAAVIVTATAISALAFGFAGWRLVAADHGTSLLHEPQAYFYDLHTGQLFTAPAGTPGAIQRPGGTYNGHPAGVRAHVFACGQCSDASKHFIGWLEIDGLSIGKQPATEEDETVYIRRVDGTQWVSSESAVGEQITSEAISQCGSGRVNFCRPEHEGN